MLKHVSLVPAREVLWPGEENDDDGNRDSHTREGKQVPKVASIVVKVSGPGIACPVHEGGQ